MKRKAEAARPAPKVVTKTMNVSPAFADMIVTLARSKGLTVRDYCDQHGAPKFAADHRAHLAAELKRMEA